MKNYTITVNGNVYDVTVEETGAGASTCTSCTESSTKSSSKGSTESGSRSSRIY